MNTTYQEEQSSSAAFAAQIDQACAQACSAIAPAWPLDRSIAVNPHWGRVAMPLRQVAARMAVLGGIQVFPPRDYVSQAWSEGRISANDLAYALRTVQSEAKEGVDAAQCLAALQQNKPVAQLPLLIDVLDDDPERHTRLSWRQAITHQVSQSCASYFDQHQADWQPERGQGLYAFWRESLIHDHGIGLLMGLPHLGQQLKALPATWQDAEQWVLQRLGLPPQVWADYLEAVLLTVNGWASWCAYLGWQAQQEGKTDSSLRELIAERTIAGLASARARGRKGGRPFKMTAAKLRLAMAAMGQPETKVGDLCRELGITRQTLYRHISPKGDLRPDGAKLLSRT